MNDKLDLVIYINMFVHYPETFNSSAICNKLNSYFNKYLLNNDFTYNLNCDVMINSAPHIEDESIVMEVDLYKNIDDSSIKETFVQDFKKIVAEYFDNRIKNVEIKFIRVDN